MNLDTIADLINELRKFPGETEWVEFKLNKIDFEEIGRNISAISNSAALLSKIYGYIIWGINDSTHSIEGTTFKPRSAKVGNEELENWLLRQLDPRIDFRIVEAVIEGKDVVLFEIPPAPDRPVRFKNYANIRVGSYTKLLNDYPEKERSLWRLFDKECFDTRVAKEYISASDVLDLLDYPNYFKLLKESLPDNRTNIIERLKSENIILESGEAKYSITNLGAVLFASDLREFNRLSRKSLRVIIYDGSDRVKTIKETSGVKGYAIGFEGAMQYINDQLPQNEQVDQALRREVKMYPEIAIRELVANCIIHQDFNITGAGPKVEIFNDRMEITNPGIPLIDPERFIDEPPRSRNEAIAALMRRMAMCEERGSGIDKVIFNVEIYQLPPPDFRVSGSNTIAVLYGPRSFSQMSRAERIRACYQHACLQYVSGKRMSNATLRKRLGIDDKNYPQASRIIRDAVEASRIKAHEEGSASKRDASYIPYYA